MEEIISFLRFSEPNLRTVVLGTALLSASSAVVGVFTFLRKRSLSGDVVSHAVLPGICIAFLLTGEKNPIVLLIGAFVSGWLSLLFVDWIKRSTRLSEDAALGISLSLFFGLGIMLLTMIQHSDNAAQAGLDRFLFGKAAALLREDIFVFGILSVTLLFTIILFYKEFALISFDREFAITTGHPVKMLEFILTTLTVLAVVTGIQAVGVVLMAALLITPAVAARFWTEKLWLILILAAFIGALSALAGNYQSYSYESMPTGPWMVVFATFFAAISAVIAPKRGAMARIWIKLNTKLRIQEENVLKLIWQLSERKNDKSVAINRGELLHFRKSLSPGLTLALWQLGRKGFLEKVNGKWKMTFVGWEKGKRITRLHRLWEMYLHIFLHIPADHVHEDAETIEHFITPEIEAQLERELDHPEVDPHQTQIPRS